MEWKKLDGAFMNRNLENIALFTYSCNLPKTNAGY